MRPGIRALLFDAGGTLIHPDGRRVCSAAGIPFRVEVFRNAEAAAVGAVRAWIDEHPQSTDAERLSPFLDAMLEALGVEEGAERLEAARRVVAEHRAENLWSAPADGAEEVLEALKARGYRLGVISNADGRVRALLESAGLCGFLELVVDSAEAGLEKPDSRIFLLATERLGLPANACAYVGDIYEIDVLGARAAGLEALLIGDSPAPASVARVPNLSALLPLFPGPDLEIRPPVASEWDAVRTLFQEYSASLSTDLEFQDFARELASLPGDYSPLDGRLLLAARGGSLAGCVALRKLSAEICEMKRLYIRPDFRRGGVGRALVEAILAEARAIGYRKMRLDTLPSMIEAISLYRSMGFTEIAPYRPNPVPGALFLERDL